jgi:hypothetical protein
LAFQVLAWKLICFQKNFMKGKLQPFVLLAGVCFFFSCSPKLAPPGHYQDSPIIVDGNISDWGFPLRFSNPDYNMEFEVSNDKKSVYICILIKTKSRMEITDIIPTILTAAAE